MENKFIVIGLDNSVSKPMTKKEAINKVKDNYHSKITSYIVSQEEGIRINKEGNFITPEWS